MKTCPACAAAIGWPGIDWHPLLCGACGALQETGPEERKLPHIDGYEVVHLIGGGGMGEVWLARELALDRFVSLKVVRSERISEEGLLRFRREAELSARLQHPSILQVFKFGASGPIVYYTMPYVPGPSLEMARQWASAAPSGAALWLDLLGRRTDPAAVTDGDHDAGLLADGDDDAKGTIHVLCERFAELATGLHAVHTAGAIHRDIKPGNILVAPDGRLKLTDFGLAQVEGRAQITQTGVLTGTPSFMSPEQVMSHVLAVDHRTDIYSLALTLYCCLLGQHPFPARDLRDLFKKITMTMPQRPSRLRPGFPPELEAILLHALEKNPADRYASAKEFAGDLVRFTHFEPIVARPVSVRSHLGLFLRRHRALAKVLVFLVATLVLARGVVLSIDTRTTVARREEAQTILQDLRPRLDSALADAAWSLALTSAGARAEAEGDDAAVLADLAAIRPEIERAVAADPGSAEARDELATVVVFQDLMGSEQTWRKGNRARAAVLLQHATEAAHGQPHLEEHCRRVAARRYLFYEGPGTASNACLVRTTGNDEIRIALQEGRNELPPAGTWTLLVTDDSGTVLRAPVRVLLHTSIEQKIQVPVAPGSVREQHPGMVMVPGGLTECGCPVGSAANDVMTSRAARTGRSAGGMSDGFRPRRFVHIPPFLVAEREVTNGEYLAFVEATDEYQRAMDAARRELPDMANRAARITPYPLGWGATKPEGRQLDFPVIGVSIVEALAYAKWKGGRLPTGDEWEKAARGVDGATYRWGSEFTKVHAKGLAAIWPVGTRDIDRSPYGLFDVLGNAAEWVDEPENRWTFDSDELGAAGDELVRRGEISEALEAYRRARELDPSDGQWQERIDEIAAGRLPEAPRSSRTAPPEATRDKKEWAALRGGRAVPPLLWQFRTVRYGEAQTQGQQSGFRLVMDCRR